MSRLGRACLLGLLPLAAAAEPLTEAEVRSLARPGAIWCYWPIEGPGCFGADLIGPRKGNGFASAAHFALELVTEGGRLARRIAAVPIDYVFEAGRLCETAPPDPAAARVYLDPEGTLKPFPEAAAAPDAADLRKIAEFFAVGGPDRVCFTFEAVGPTSLGLLHRQTMWVAGVPDPERADFVVLPPGSTVRLDPE